MMFSISTSSKSTRKRSSHHPRLGVAAVELAVCLPMLTTLVFGTIEATNAIFLQRALITAAYEAGNVAAALGGTSDGAITRANAVLSCMGVNSATVTITPTTTIDTTTGTTIVITCSAPLRANTATSWCLGNPTLIARFSILHL